MRLVVKWTLIVVGMLAAGGLVFVGWAVVAGTRMSLDAERTHQAYCMVLELVGDHVERTGQWPKKWEDLYSAPQNIAGSPRWFEDPERVAQVEKRVIVDFTVRSEDVGLMSPDSFDAIRPTFPNYGRDIDWVKYLIKKCRERAAKEDSQP